MKKVIWVVLLLTSFFLYWCIEKEYPEVNIDIISSTGNIWPTKNHTIRASVSWATEAFVDNENVVITHGVIEKKVVLENMSQVFNIQAKNPWNSDFELLSLTREKTEEELEEEARKLSYNKDFINKCSSQIKSDSQAVFQIIGEIKVSDVSEYNEDASKIEGKFIENFTVNPIRNIYYTNTYSCSQDKKTKKLKIQILDMKMESAPCPDWSNPPAGMRCK